MSLRKFAFHDRSTAFFVPLVGVFAAFALAPAPSYIPTVLTLSTLLVYSRILFPSNNAARDSGLLWLALSVGGSIPKLEASLNALSTPGMSLVVLFSMSGITSAVILGTLYVEYRFSTRISSRWSQMTLFPAIWATTWETISYMSPVGRLSAWSPVDDMTCPPALDWIVAAWAVVCYQLVDQCLGDYIDATNKFTSAKILLWPEGAVSFNSEAERNQGLQRVMREVRGPYVGVSFEETISNPHDKTGRSVLKRTGLAVVSNTSATPHLVRRILLPFSFDRSPNYIYLPLTRPKNGDGRVHWPGNSIRPVPLTASICLDFTAPEPFAALPSRPAIILAPARTWQLSVSNAMWRQARQRAEEIGSTVLWCDGGESGLSGIAGGGLYHPFDERRTVYAVLGDTTLIIFWIIALGSGAILRGGSVGFGVRSIQQLLTSWRGRQREEISHTETDLLVQVHLGGLVSRTTPSSRNLLQSRFARSLRGSLRSSTLKPFARSFRDNSITGSDIPDDDFQHISREELPIQLDEDHTNLHSPPNHFPTQVPPSVSPPRIQTSLPQTQKPQTNRRPSKASRSRLSFTELTFEFPQPPTYIPTPQALANRESRHRPTDQIEPAPISPQEVTNSEYQELIPFVPHPRELSSFKGNAFPISVNRVKAFTKTIFRAAFQASSSSSTAFRSKKSARGAENTSNERKLTTQLSPTLQPQPLEPPAPHQPFKPRIYERVDPIDLTASPAPHLVADLFTCSTRTSFLPPSPSWLSRNVASDLSSHSTEISQAQSPVQPPTNSRPKYLAPLQLFVTSAPSPLGDTEGLLRRSGSLGPDRASSRTPSIHSLSVSRCSSLTGSLHPLSTVSPNNNTSEDLIGVIPHLTLTRTSSFSSQPPVTTTLFTDPREFFVPPSRSSDQDFTPLTSGLRHQLDVLCKAVGIPLANMDYAGKRTDVVDFGGETDYSNYQWFQDRPVPPPGVIEQNEAFEFALGAAPNVLYARFKQYGQLGVLAWCSEFGELIDNLKDLGFQGNMFVTTRNQALKTCEEILKLNLDLEMQIILMYLSSQVARLRRFLDGEKVWNDYPLPKFPLEPNAHYP
ncbi:hypothetical protein BD779DRAFT_1464992 [Infundibulicybe gibba]|nr:hypothetical protein BD779DRAFT_1464992 [Infundibulicybe gibba]